jgi:hypothetical protein
MNLIKIKPADGLVVMNPNGGGKMKGERDIERTPAIIRMLKDGDIVEVKKSKAVKKATNKVEKQELN